MVWEGESWSVWRVIADALVQGGIVGSAGELPERYMQAMVAGTAASGKLFSSLYLIA